MNQRWRLVSYILINILVSACVTGVILYIYDRTNQAACSPSTYSSSLLTPLSGHVQIEIISVIGAGFVASEIVVIQNTGQESVFLTGWYLQDDEGNAFTFPQLSLNPGATVQVHTGFGEDTAADLFWGHTQPVWRSGEMATIKDTQGEPHALYHIP